MNATCGANRRHELLPAGGHGAMVTCLPDVRPQIGSMILQQKIFPTFSTRRRARR
jgi:hypothetical protein